MQRDRLTVKIVALGLVGVVAVVLGLLVLAWPGPFEPTDSLPFALVFLVPGVLSVAQARWLYRRGG